MQIYDQSKSFTNIMTPQQHSFKAFVKLGALFQHFCDTSDNLELEANANNAWLLRLDTAIAKAETGNTWFTKDNILFSIKEWAKLLTEENLSNWLVQYAIGENKEKKVALILAGNIPMVGFHDLLTTLLTGNIAIVKLSSKDKFLLTFVADFLIETDGFMRSRIRFVEGLLTDYDAVIATGSTNTSRYFEYYFSKKPHLIRKNRNSIAVLTGKETKLQLQALGADIFRYYGLGCRNVSKLLVPKAYNFDVFFEAIYSYKDIINQIKYANNYDYNKAVYLMSEFAILDNGFLILKEDTSHTSPIASLFYEYYDSPEALDAYLLNAKEDLQCIVSDNVALQEIPFGTSQMPQLNEYADGVDTVEFLLKT